MTSSSLGLTHREYVDKLLTVSVAVTTFVGYVSSVYWERTWGPRLLLRREITLENEIDRLEEEADKVCTTSKLYEHSQLMRSAVGLRRELLQERRKRYRYQLSMESMFSPLSTLHSVRRNFNAREQACAAGPHAAIAAGGVARSAPNSLSQSPASGEDGEGDATRGDADASYDCAVQRVCDVVRYNLVALIKYVLRFGHLLGYLYVFGSRPGLIVMPPSLEDSAHFYLMEVVVPYVFNMAMYGPAILFAPGQTLLDNVTEAAMTTNVSLAKLGGDPYETLSAASACARETESATATTILLVKRYNLARLCESNDLVWWFFCCWCASYCLVRVFAS